MFNAPVHIYLGCNAAETSFVPLELSALALVPVTASFEGLFSAAPLFEPTGETSSLATWAVILACAGVIRRSISAVSTEDFRLRIPPAQWLRPRHPQCSIDTPP